MSTATLGGRPGAANPPQTSVQEKVQRAVVELVAIGPAGQGKDRECEGTGFLVNENGYILTNAHVVDEARRCLAGTSAGKILAKPLTAEPSAAPAVSCDVVRMDELHDLALLKAERPLFEDAAEARANVLPLNSRETLDGATVAVTGHPGFAWQPITQTGHVLRQGKVAVNDPPPTSMQVLVLDIALHKGNSGSPVYRASDGVVVGIVSRRDIQRPAQSWAIPIRYAVEMLDRAGVKWRAADK